MEKTKGSAEVYLNKLAQFLKTVNREQVDDAVRVIDNAWKSGKQIITLGNGGSALTALHFINDWNKSIYLSTKIPFRGRSLVDNMGLVLSYSNDISFEDVFVEQLKNILEPGDLVLAISGSGNSKNVIRAIDYANQNKAVTLGLCGYRGGKLMEIAQHVVWANIDDMQIAENMHAIFGHIVMQKLCGDLN
jgi:D-sedoheptulose 7-phosphate isomerase